MTMSTTRKTPVSLKSMTSLCMAGTMLGAVATAQAATPKNALVMAWNIDAISTFDPAQIGEVVTNEIVVNTCDTLVDYDPEDATKIIPLFAEKWDVSDDKMQITFHLRKGAVFPSGNKATAKDTAWSLQRVVKLGFGNAATLTEYGFTRDNVDKTIVATDDDTLVMKLDKPYPTSLVLQAIAANRVSITLDSKLLLGQDVGGDQGNKYLLARTECIGPYNLKQWNAGEAVVLEANESYWGTAPRLMRIIIRHVAEAGTQRLLLTQGDVDIARDLTPEDLRDMEKAKDIDLVQTLKPSLFYWGFNNSSPIFSNDKVRLAMRYLVDYDGLAKTVMAYIGEPRASFVQLGAFGALDKKEGQPFKLDPEKAKALLAEAGYPNGFEASMIIGTHPYAAPIAQHVQQNAAKIGVKIKIERMANAQLFSKVRGREFDTAMLGWQTSVPDAHGNASRQIYNPDNRLEAKQTMYPSWRGAFYSEEANKAVDAALLEKDEAKRRELYYDLQRQMMQTGPVAYMFQTYDSSGLRKNVKNWKQNGFKSYYSLTSKE